METPVIAKDTDVTSESTKSLGLNSDVLDKLKQELKDILCIIKEWFRSFFNILNSSTKTERGAAR